MFTRMKWEVGDQVKLANGQIGKIIGLGRWVADVQLHNRKKVMVQAGAFEKAVVVEEKVKFVLSKGAS